MKKKVGVLALQGDFEAHSQALSRAGAEPVLARTASADAARMAALDADGVAPHLAGRTLKKVVYVPGKIVNVVVD